MFILYIPLNRDRNFGAFLNYSNYSRATRLKSQTSIQGSLIRNTKKTRQILNWGHFHEREEVVKVCVNALCSKYHDMHCHIFMENKFQRTFIIWKNFHDKFTTFHYMCNKYQDFAISKLYNIYIVLWWCGYRLTEGINKCKQKPMANPNWRYIACRCQYEVFSQSYDYILCDYFV